MPATSARISASSGRILFPPWVLLEMVVAGHPRRTCIQRIGCWDRTREMARCKMCRAGRRRLCPNRCSRLKDGFRPRTMFDWLERAV